MWRTGSIFNPGPNSLNRYLLGKGEILGKAFIKPRIMKQGKYSISSTITPPISVFYRLFLPEF